MTLWTAVCQASVSFTVYWSLLKLLSVESVMPSEIGRWVAPHPVSPPSPPALNLSQHQGIFQWTGSSHKVARSFTFSISSSNEYSGLISLRIDWIDLLAVQGTCKSSPAPQFESISSLVLSLIYGPALTTIHDYWKNHSFDHTALCVQSDVSTF